MSVSPIAVSPDLLAGAPTAPQGKTRDQIAKTAKAFESEFVSIMLGQMFEGVGGGEMSGGQGGQMFQSFLMDAMSKKISQTGGLGLASSVQTEMLKLQGLK